jgi:hypothetical protein
MGNKQTHNVTPVNEIFMRDPVLSNEKNAHSESVMRENVSQEFETNGGKEISAV